MLSEQIERRVLSERQALLGRPGIDYDDLPTVGDALDSFTAGLAEKPEQVAPIHAARLRALGLTS